MFNNRWRLEGLVEYVDGTAIAGHYITWIRNETCWTILDDDHVSTRGRLNKGLRNYRTLLFRRISI